MEVLGLCPVEAWLGELWALLCYRVWWVQFRGSLNILWDGPSLGLEWKHLFQSCGHCWIFQIFWHIEWSSFTASSFRIWNSSTGIPSPPLSECFNKTRTKFPINTLSAKKVLILTLIQRVNIHSHSKLLATGAGFCKNAPVDNVLIGTHSMCSACSTNQPFLHLSPSFRVLLVSEARSWKTS